MGANQSRKAFKAALKKHRMDKISKGQCNSNKSLKKSSSASEASSCPSRGGSDDGSIHVDSPSSSIKERKVLVSMKQNNGGNIKGVLKPRSSQHSSQSSSPASFHNRILQKTSSVSPSPYTGAQKSYVNSAKTHCSASRKSKTLPLKLPTKETHPSPLTRFGFRSIPIKSGDSTDSVNSILSDAQTPSDRNSNVCDFIEENLNSCSKPLVTDELFIREVESIDNIKDENSNSKKEIRDNSPCNISQASSGVTSSINGSRLKAQTKQLQKPQIANVKSSVLNTNRQSSPVGSNRVRNQVRSTVVKKEVTAAMSSSHLVGKAAKKGVSIPKSLSKQTPVSSLPKLKLVNGNVDLPKLHSSVEDSKKGNLRAGSSMSACLKLESKGNVALPSTPKSTSSKIDIAIVRKSRRHSRDSESSSKSNSDSGHGSSSENSEKVVKNDEICGDIAEKSRNVEMLDGSESMDIKDKYDVDISDVWLSEKRSKMVTPQPIDGVSESPRPKSGEHLNSFSMQQPNSFSMARKALTPYSRNKIIHKNVARVCSPTSPKRDIEKSSEKLSCVKSRIARLEQAKLKNDSFSSDKNINSIKAKMKSFNKIERPVSNVDISGTRKEIIELERSLTKSNSLRQVKTPLIQPKTPSFVTPQKIAKPVLVETTPFIGVSLQSSGKDVEVCKPVCRRLDYDPPTNITNYDGNKICDIIGRESLNISSSADSSRISSLHNEENFVTDKFDAIHMKNIEESNEYDESILQTCDSTVTKPDFVEDLSISTDSTLNSNLDSNIEELSSQISSLKISCSSEASFEVIEEDVSSTADEASAHEVNSSNVTQSRTSINETSVDKRDTENRPCLKVVNNDENSKAPVKNPVEEESVHRSSVQFDREGSSESSKSTNSCASLPPLSKQLTKSLQNSINRSHYASSCNELQSQNECLSMKPASSLNFTGSFGRRSGKCTPNQHRDSDQDFLIDDEISDQPGLTFGDVDSMDSILGDENLFSEEHDSGGVRLTEGRSRTDSASSSLGAEDLMLDFDADDCKNVKGQKLQSTSVDVVDGDKAYKCPYLGKRCTEDIGSPVTSELFTEWTAMLEDAKVRERCISQESLGLLHCSSPPVSGVSTTQPCPDRRVSLDESTKSTTPPDPGGFEMKNRTGVLKPPRTSTPSDVDGLVYFDRTSLHYMCQDVTSIKTMLLKLRRKLQSVDTVNPFDNCIKNSLYLSLGVSESFTEETQMDTDLLQQNVDLKRQVVLLKQEVDEKDRTIRILQQQLAQALTQTQRVNSTSSSVCCHASPLETSRVSSNLSSPNFSSGNLTNSSASVDGSFSSSSVNAATQTDRAVYRPFNMSAMSRSTEDALGPTVSFESICQDSTSTLTTSSHSVCAPGGMRIMYTIPDIPPTKNLNSINCSKCKVPSPLREISFVSKLEQLATSPGGNLVQCGQLLEEENTPPSPPVMVSSTEVGSYINESFLL